MPELVAGSGITLTEDTGAGTLTVSGGGSVGVSVKDAPFNAVGDGVTDDSAAFVAAIAYLKTYALNAGGGVFKGSPKLFIPAGDYYLGSTTLDINHTLIIEGEGSGRNPAPAYGCTHLRWANGVCGIRTHLFNTSGTTTVDGPHDGAGSAYLRGFTMQGGYAGTNGSSHAIVARAITFLDDILIRQWSGTGVLSWTGTVLAVAYAGNTSVSRYTGVKVEGCKIGFDTRGTDSNVITFLNCEAYQCRQAGFIDDNGAGSNTYIGCHAPYNGMTGLGITTQVTNSSKWYAVKWGQETGAATNAPSGTTDDNTWWAYVGPGSADSIHPAWVSGMSGLASGGDYVMLSAFPTILINCYSEGGGFSQLGTGTLAIGGTNLGLSSIGGSCLVPEYDGLSLKRLHDAAIIHCDGSSGSLNGVDVRNVAGTQVGGSLWSDQIAFHRAASANGHFFQTLSGGTPTTRATVVTTGLDLPTGHVVSVNGTQVVAARGAAVADATGAGDVVAQLNAALARLRAHGLIAP